MTKANAKESSEAEKSASADDRKKVKFEKSGVVSFNMAQFTSSANNDCPPGPLVDDAAPYSGMGLVEFRALQKVLLPNWNGSFGSLPLSIKERPFWQYGSGNHASPPRRIIGTVRLQCIADQGTAVGINHLIIDGSSQWVVGRNVTSHCNIEHINGHHLSFNIPNSASMDTMSMVTFGDHSYLPVSMFMASDAFDVVGRDNPIVSLSCSVSAASLSWPELKRMIDKIHKHVCGHASYDEIKLLMKRNDLWNGQCSKYLSQQLESCKSCVEVKLPKSARKVSLGSVSREFNDLVCVDHFFPDQLDVFHIMDNKTRYSTGDIVPSLQMSDAIPVFDAKWLSEFWPPGEIHGDKAFDNVEFRNYLSTYEVVFHSFPPRRHYKNVIESKHRVLRDIYLRLKSENTDQDPRLLVSKMFRISNDLYGNNIASAHELAKGYTRPIFNSLPKILPPDIRQAQEELSAKRKLNMILSSKSITEQPVHVGDIIQVYTRLQNQKRGTWSEPIPVLEYDHLSRTVTVAGARGRRKQAAIEDIRRAPTENALAVAIQRASDELSEDIDVLLSEEIDTNPAEDSGDETEGFSNAFSTEDEDVVSLGR